MHRLMSTDEANSYVTTNGLKYAVACGTNLAHCRYEFLHLKTWEKFLPVVFIMYP